MANPRDTDAIQQPDRGKPFLGKVVDALRGPMPAPAPAGPAGVKDAIDKSAATPPYPAPLVVPIDRRQYDTFFLAGVDGESGTIEASAIPNRWIVYPQTAYTGVNGLWLRPADGGVAAAPAVTSQDAPVWLGLDHTLIIPGRSRFLSYRCVGAAAVCIIAVTNLEAGRV